MCLFAFWFLILFPNHAWKTGAEMEHESCVKKVWKTTHFSNWVWFPHSFVISIANSWLQSKFVLECAQRSFAHLLLKHQCMLLFLWHSDCFCRSAVSYASLNWNNDLNEARRDFYSNVYISISQSLFLFQPGTDKLRWRAMAYVERQNGNCDNARSLYEECMLLCIWSHY